MTTEQLYGFRASALHGMIERYQVVKINPCTIKYKDYGGIKQERLDSDNYGWFSTYDDAATWLKIKLTSQRVEVMERVAEIESSIAKINDGKFRDVVPLPYDTKITLE